MSTRTPARVSGPIFFVLPLAVHLMASPLAGQIKLDDDEPDEDPPVVTITPSSGTWNNPGPVEVTITWCDDRQLDAGSREIKLNNVDVTSDFDYTPVNDDPPFGCNGYAISEGDVTLDVGSNTLSASISDEVNTGTGFAAYTYEDEVPPFVSASVYHNGQIVSQGMCAACFDQVYAYTTPAYFSMDAPQAVTFYYSSYQAKPVGWVGFEAWNPPENPNPPDKMSLSLERGDGTVVTFTNGSDEIYWDYADNDTIRLTAQFDASSLSTGAYGYTAVIRSWWGSTSEENTQSVRVLVLNEANSYVAAGWTIAGAQTLIPQGDSLLLLADGAGTLIAFDEVAPDTFEAGRGDFTRIRKTGSGEYVRVGMDSVRTYYSTHSLSVRIDSIVDVFGNKGAFEYDASGRLETITDPMGKEITIAYEGASGGISSVTDPGGRQVDFTGESFTGDLVEIEDPDGIGRSFTYDSDHRMLSVTDREGATTDYSYGTWGRLDTVRLAQVELFDGSSVRPTLAYESPELRAMVPPDSGTFSDPAGSVYPDSIYGVVVGPRGDTVRAWYNGLGQAVKTVDPLGRTTVRGYTGDGRLSALTTPSGQGYSWNWGNGGELLYSETIEDLRTTSYIYDMDWKQPEHVLVAGDTSRTHYFGPLGTIDSVRIADFADKIHYVRDARGRDSVIVEMAGNETKFYYDSEWGNVFLIVREGGAQTSYEFDAYGRRDSVYDPMGALTFIERDELNRVTAVYHPVNPNPTQTHYGPIYADSITNAKGERHRFVHNGLGWVTEEYGPASASTGDVYGYDAAGNVVEWVNRNGDTIRYQLDVLGRTTKITAPDDTVELGYDPSGQDRFVWSANEWATDTTWLTPLGQVDSTLSVRDWATYGVGYSHEHWSGKVTEIYDGFNDRSLRFHYNDQGQADTLWAGPSKTWVDARNSNRFVTARHYAGAALRQEQSYTAVNRRAEIAWIVNPAGDTLTTRLYGFDEANRITHVDPSGEKKFSYEYDDLHRLEKVREYEQTQECVFQPPYYLDCSGTNETLVDSAVYSYDEVGNRTDGSASIDPGSRLRSMVIGGDTVEYDYDDAGNVTARRLLIPGAADTLQELYWGALGRLDSVRVSAGSPGSWTAMETVRYRYGPPGSRIWKSTESDTLEYVWANGHVLFDLKNGTDTTEYSYLTGVDRPHSMRRNGVAYYYLLDYLGTAVGVVDSTGALENEYEYNAWGRPVTVTENVPNALTFAGREYDEETGWYHLRARYYDPLLGRFLSEDPIGLAGGINAYAYAGNDPIAVRDPSGLQADEGDGEDDGQTDQNTCDAEDREGCIWGTVDGVAVAVSRGVALVGGDWLGFNGGRNPGRAGPLAGVGGGGGQQQAVEYIPSESCPGQITPSIRGQLEGYWAESMRLSQAAGRDIELGGYAYDSPALPGSLTLPPSILAVHSRPTASGRAEIFYSQSATRVTNGFPFIWHAHPMTEAGTLNVPSIQDYRATMNFPNRAVNHGVMARDSLYMIFATGYVVGCAR